VSTNGLISFCSGLTLDSEVAEFPLGESACMLPTTSSLSLIAPFWADLHFEMTGRRGLYVRVVQRPAKITDRVIGGNPLFSSFRARTVLVATWNRPTLVHRNLVRKDQDVSERGIPTG
jgi:hypothetical protein